MRRPVTAALCQLRRAANRVWSLWREFWFKPADPTPLGVMRILFGGMLFYTHLVWGMNLEGFFGPNGWQSATLVRTVQQGQLAWSFWWWVPDGMRLPVHLVCLGILLLFMVGAFTRVTSILAYVITVSYAYRAPLANYGLDQINGIAALYLAIGPSGAALSVDRLWRRYRLAASALRAGKSLPAPPPVCWSPRANLALRLMQVHLCVIYLFACHSKLQGESWWSGQAIWQAVSNLEYQSADLTWLAWYPWLVNLLTHATIVWEMTFWALVWRPLCRPIVLLIGVAIHLGIGAFMGMWTFGLAVTFLYLAFVPAATINAVLSTGARVLAKVAGWLRLDPQRSTRPRVKALCEALRFHAPVPATVPAIVIVSSETSSADQSPPAIPPVIPVSLPAAPEVVAPLIAADSEQLVDRPAEKVRRPVGANERNMTPRGQDLPGFRPVLVLVESRLKRQTQIQEYLVKRGFRCFVASELNQARSLLTVVDVDALVVTSTWFPEEEIRSFREALISGGPALPASLFFVTGINRRFADQLADQPRHRLVRRPLSLHELRLLVAEVLGLPEKRSHSGPSRPTPLSNGNGHQSDAAEPLAGDPLLEPAAIEVEESEKEAPP